MNASGVLRKLKDLDALEKRVKLQVQPSPRMLQEIEKERAQLLKGDSDETQPRK